MKLVQARIEDAEFQVLQRRAKQEGKPMQEVVREALRRHLLPDTVDPDDPLFTKLPTFRSKDGRRARVAERHDEYLYGDAHDLRR